MQRAPEIVQAAQGPCVTWFDYVLDPKQFEDHVSSLIFMGFFITHVFLDFGVKEESNFVSNFCGDDSNVFASCSSNR